MGACRCGLCQPLQFGLANFQRRILVLERPQFPLQRGLFRPQSGIFLLKYTVTRRFPLHRSFPNNCHF
jgi:hypothetical protein